MKRMTDKTRNLIFWTMFGCVTLLLLAAFAVGLAGFVKKIDFLIHLSLVLIPCGLLVNVINVFAFKPHGKKSEKNDNRA